MVYVRFKSDTGEYVDAHAKDIGAPGDGMALMAVDQDFSTWAPSRWNAKAKAPFLVSTKPLADLKDKTGWTETDQERVLKEIAKALGVM